MEEGAKAEKCVISAPVARCVLPTLGPSPQPWISGLRGAGIRQPSEVPCYHPPILTSLPSFPADTGLFTAADYYRKSDKLIRKTIRFTRECADHPYMKVVGGGLLESLKLQNAGEPQAESKVAVAFLSLFRAELTLAGTRPCWSSSRILKLVWFGLQGPRVEDFEVRPRAPKRRVSDETSRCGGVHSNLADCRHVAPPRRPKRRPRTSAAGGGNH